MMRYLFVPFALLSSLLSVPVDAQLDLQTESSARRLITVTGEAELVVEPDQIILTLGLETTEVNLLEAKRIHDVLLVRLRAGLTALEIENRQIQTDYIEVEPRYEHKPGSNSFVGYVVRQTLVVTLHDVSRYEPVLAASLEAGANHVLDVQFRSSEERKYRDEARAQAIRAAREKATALAGELEQTLGRPFAISELGSDRSSWYGSGWGRRGRPGAPNFRANLRAGTDGGALLVAPGQISVSAAVQVSFELE